MTDKRAPALPKFVIPRRRSDTIRRGRLTDGLNEWLDRGVAVITAPAGFGKTTLAVDWVDEAALPAAWLSLDSQDLDPLTLLSDLVVTVRHTFPSSLGDLAGRLAAGTTPGSVEALLREFAAAVGDIDELLLLVLDDLHVIEESPESVELLDSLLRIIPLNMRLLLCSRTRPTLPTLPRMAAQRRSYTMEAASLAFTEAEGREFLRSSGVDDPASQEELLRRADGWPAALAILADHHGTGRTGGGSEAEFTLFDFLDREVVSRLPAGGRELLTACSVTPHFDAALATSLTGEEHSAGLLREIESSNHLLSRLEGGEWFRMHSLLRQYFLDGLERDDPARLRALRRRASAAFRGRGDRRAAIEMAIEAGDWPDVVAELHDLQEELYQRGEWATLIRWLDALPEDVLRGHVDLYLTRVRVATKADEPQKSLSLLDALDLDGLDASVRIHVHLHRATALRQTRRFDPALEEYRRARALAEETEPNGSRLRAELDLEHGIALGMSGRLDGARTKLEAAAEAFELLGDNHRTGEAYQNLGTALLFQGFLTESIEASTAAQRRWQQLAEPDAHLLTMNNLASAQRTLGELRTAQDTFREIAHRADELELPRRSVAGRVGEAEVALDLGNLDAADELFSAAIRQAEAADHGGMIAAATFGLAMVCRGRSEYSRAMTLLQHGQRSAEQSGALELQARFGAGIGATLLDEHRHAEAVPILERAVADASEAGALLQQTLTRFLLAGAHYYRRKRALCTAELKQVQELVRVLGHDRFLHAEARLLPELVAYGAGKRIGGGYFRVLQRELGDVETGHPVEHASTPNAEFGIRAEVFGHPRVMVSARQIADLEWRSERSKELFFYLLHARRPLRKEQIASDLWPELTPDRVNSMFHSTLYRLRRAIDPQIAVQTDGGYQISPTFTISYDAREFDELVGEAEAARPGSEDAVRPLREAVDLYRGPFADGFVSEWAESSRRHFEQRYFSSLLALADHALRTGDLVEAARLSEIALSTDALSEEAARLLMVAHSRAGRLDLAARAYRHVHEAMERELGEEPSAATQETYRQVLTGAALGSNGD